MIRLFASERKTSNTQETAAKSGEIAQLQQEGPLPSTDAEGTLPTPQAATDADSGRDPEKLSERWELVAILLVLAVAGVVGVRLTNHSPSFSAYCASSCLLCSGAQSQVGLLKPVGAVPILLYRSNFWIRSCIR